MTDDEKEAALRRVYAGLQGDAPPFGDVLFLLCRLDEARAENADLQRTFDLMWAADQRAIKIWQDANPGHEMVWPDRAKLTGWLLERYDTRIAELLAANNREVERCRQAKAKGVEIYLDMDARLRKAQDERDQAQLAICDAGQRLRDALVGTDASQG